MQALTTLLLTPCLMIAKTVVPRTSEAAELSKRGPMRPPPDRVLAIFAP